MDAVSVLLSRAIIKGKPSLLNEINVGSSETTREDSLKTNNKIPRSKKGTHKVRSAKQWNGFDAQPLGKLQKPWRIPGDYERQDHQSAA